MFSGLFVFAVTYLVAVASPGPGIAAIVARVLAKGTFGMPAFVAGFIVGDLLWIGAAAGGMTVLMQSFSLVFLIFKYAGAIYLAFTAWKLWTAPMRELAGDQNISGERGSDLFSAGLTSTLSNPKVMMFFIAILPTLVSLEDLSLSSLIEIAALIMLILSTVFGAYIFAAMRARNLFRSTRSLQRLNRGAGVVMAGAAVTIAVR